MSLGCHPVTHPSPARLTWIVAAPPTWSYPLPLFFSLSSTCSQSQPASAGQLGPLPTEHLVAPSSPAVKGRAPPLPLGLGLPRPPAPPLDPWPAFLFSPLLPSAPDTGLCALFPPWGGRARLGCLCLPPFLFSFWKCPSLLLHCQFPLFKVVTRGHVSLSEK